MDRKCSRTVLRNKLERAAVESREWWAWLFSSMEANAAIPPDRRECVLKEILPEKIFSKVLDILGVDENYEEDIGSDKASGDSLIQKATSFPHIPVAHSDSFSVIEPRKERLMDTRKELEEKSKELEEKGSKELEEKGSKESEEKSKETSKETSSIGSGVSSESAINGLKQKRKEIGPKNPYLRFQDRRLDRAAIWYPKPPLLLEGMNLIQKADAITEQIAYDFVEWLKTITDPDDVPSSLTVLTIKKMFTIGYNTHAAKSLSIKMKEMASVPESVAKLVNVPEMSRRNQLHQQIRRDANAAVRTGNNFAFGTKLPSEMIGIPPKVEDTRKWLVCDNVPKDLESMATVWRGITHLRSTRGYCQYLLENPDIRQPQYLIDCNMMDPTFLRGPHVSIDSGRGDGQLILPPGVQEEEQPAPQGGVL